MIYESREAALGAFNRYEDNVDNLKDEYGIECFGPITGPIEYGIKYKAKNGVVRTLIV